MINAREQLSIFGGTPVRSRPWPKWPRGSPGSQRNLFHALHSGKWAISGVGGQDDSYESRLGSAYAGYAGRAFGVPCSSGTAALTISLQALGVGPGDAVVIPGLTWVACASSVLNLGATPILCDVDTETLCVTPNSVADALSRSNAVRAVLMVHMYGSLCDIDGFVDVCERHRVSIIEDASQAHGGRWRGKPIGSFGTVSAFSFQHSKLLTCGEGGICLTDDSDLFLRLQELRADGRVYTDVGSVARDRYKYELKVRGSVSGRNLCMSEFQAAVALDGLSSLDAETQTRTRTASHLKLVLAGLGGARLTACPEGADTRPYYRVSIRLEPEIVGSAPIELVAAALARELHTDARPLDQPLDVNPLYQPKQHPFVQRSSALAQSLAAVETALPNAHQAYGSTVSLPHQILLSADEDMNDVGDALAKLKHVNQSDPDWHRALSLHEAGGSLA